MPRVRRYMTVNRRFQRLFSVRLLLWQHCLHHIAYKIIANCNFFQTEDTKGVLMANGQMLITEVDEDNEPKSLPIIVSINWIYSFTQPSMDLDMQLFLGPGSLDHGSLVLPMSHIICCDSIARLIFCNHLI